MRPLPTGDGWAMQYNRVLRSRANLDVPYNSTEEYDDAVYRFFQDAGHLKDWLKGDPAVPTSVSHGVEKFVASRPCLRAAADLANGSKHFELTKHIRDGVSIVERRLTVRVGKEPAVEHTHQLLLGNGTVTTAVSLADEVIMEWQAFVRAEGLLSS